MIYKHRVLIFSIFMAKLNKLNGLVSWTCNNIKSEASKQKSCQLEDVLIPLESTRTEAPELSWIDFIKEPCFPIKLMACVDATNNLIEQNATPAAPVVLPSPSPSGSPLTRLKILIMASIAGDKAASGSSFPDIKTWNIWEVHHHLSVRLKDQLEQTRENICKP